MTTEEAIALIEAATGPAAIFGSPAGPGKAAQQTYRRLASLVHPDSSPGTPVAADAGGRPPATPRSDRATSAFAKLAALWQQHREGSASHNGGALVASGDIASITRIPGRTALLKLARDPADGDLIAREATALRWLAHHGDPAYLPYVPRLVESRRYADPATGVTRRGNVIAELDGFIGLDTIRERFPNGLDPRDVAWIWRRALVAVGFAHRTGIVHGAALPPHLLIQPNDHGLCLIDYCYSSGGPNPGTLPAIVTKYRDWYPPEVGRGYLPAPDLDIYLVTRSMTSLIAKPLPAPLGAFAAGCTPANPARRPSDAWELLRELDDLIDRLWGPRKFRPFPDI
jgi:serine/threonine protein kinase